MGTTSTTVSTSTALPAQKEVGSDANKADVAHMRLNRKEKVSYEPAPGIVKTDVEVHCTHAHSLEPVGAGNDLGEEPTHVMLKPSCFSRATKCSVMAAVRASPSLRCLASLGAPIELRLLNDTGFALMCSASNIPLASTGDRRTLAEATLFVYARARSVTIRSVWPNKVPRCDRTDVIRTLDVASEAVDM